jgi:hypothetical protein
MAARLRAVEELDTGGPKSFYQLADGFFGLLVGSYAAAGGCELANQPQQ